MAAIFSPESGGFGSKTDLKLPGMTGESSGRAHSKAETSGSRFHIPRRLANEWRKFEVESKWPKYHFSKGVPRSVAKSTSILDERSEEGDHGGK